MPTPNKIPFTSFVLVLWPKSQSQICPILAKENQNYPHGAIPLDLRGCKMIKKIGKKKKQEENKNSLQFSFYTTIIITIKTCYCSESGTTCPSKRTLYIFNCAVLCRYLYKVHSCSDKRTQHQHCKKQFTLMNNQLCNSRNRRQIITQKMKMNPLAHHLYFLGLLPLARSVLIYVTGSGNMCCRKDDFHFLILNSVTYCSFSSVIRKKRSQYG